MTTQNLALFKGMGAKMQYLNHRQQVISQNIANADTPGYRPQDLTGVKFDSVLRTIDRKNGAMGSVTLAATQKGHLPPADQVRTGDVDEQRQTYEVAPAGNSVIIEEQMIKSNETAMDYSLMTNLYRKNVGMIMTALGRQG